MKKSNTGDTIKWTILAGVFFLSIALMNGIAPLL